MNSFALKFEDVDLVISHIERLEGEAGNVGLSSVLKSGIVLNLYNIVESSVTEMITALHDVLSNLDYNEVNDKIKKLYTGFLMKDDSLISTFVNEGFRFPDFELYSEKIKIYSGNLDFREIKIIFSKYGFSFKSNCSGFVRNDVLKIKDYRNKLAHGEIGFRGLCFLSIREIKKLRDSLFVFFNDLLKKFSCFMHEKKYRSDC